MSAAMMKRIQLLLGAVVVLASSSSYAAISIGGNTALAGYDPVHGAIYSELRSTLVADFPGSTFSSLSVLSGDLSSHDVLILNRFQSASLTPAEQTAVYQYVAQGGNLIYVGDAADQPNDTFTQPFGITMVPDPAVPSGLFFANYTNLSHPYLTGPFGAPASLPSGGIAAMTTGLGASVELAKWQGGGVAISVLNPDAVAPGSGFALFFTDVNMFTPGRYSSEVGPLISNALLTIPEPSGVFIFGAGILSILSIRRPHRLP